MDLPTNVSGTDRLAAAVAGIEGVSNCDDVGWPDADEMPATAPEFLVCQLESQLFEAVAQGKLAFVTTGHGWLSVHRLPNGSYYCSTLHSGAWIASSVEAARAWLRAGVGVDVLTDSPAETV